ncbi:MAG: hypothetical protein ACD_42C00040G0003 [uncultured bacterium]|nr:MAG: hypothetical protein ACD_42C00040G0003 [uncultured bacterium]OGT32572.1 MAG: hypothetical protein A3C44_02390 [Gammaproteobacteria bacterium RIFCSPHIGHO2_02_FULL_39_13]OGT48382.1 MAG: hypothetical protein A3E53_06085 [Gammaproteobacteria bacterium RIFCSPHIGHO2_12_FULL_39_24]
MICIKATVHGKVQGVFYREGTRKKARSLNITGWVKNNDDGTVELFACGDSEKIKNLIEWLWRGPLLARVEKVDWSEAPEEKQGEFVVLR